MASKKHAEVLKAADGLSKKDDISLIDVLSLAETSIHSMKSFIDSLDSEVYKEFRQIAEYIQNTKTEIGHLQANDMRSKHIPEAGLVLSAIVSSTEDATNKIMECAEEVLDADSSNQEAYQQFVNDKMMLIFEACSFQDLTGQRISKVVETLEYIDTRISRFASAIEAEDTEAPVSAKEKKRRKRKKDQILNGPALEGEGGSQDDIDALLNA
ncbi:MAG: protein phosphatase CheZ [Alphaproteobacteria bacterium]